ncbi:MAG: NAD(P)-dependent oxidoreductase [Desulfovibrionaceae bacterium]|nr:NAD(P)-dependent oxidoreductase [Desulfovibrionaceae bacterium]
MKIVLLEGLGVSDQIIASHVKKLEEMGHTFTAYEKNTDAAVQAERCKDADVVMIANMPLAKSAVEGAENLKFIDVAFTGVDHIPVEAAKARGIAVSNASGYASQAVAELAICFMIELLRKIPQTSAQCRASGTKAGLEYRLLAGKTVGIVGCGAIGKRTAALCKAFGATVIGYNRSKVTDPSIDEQVSLEELLSRADVVSLHTPLTPQTKGLIGSKELGQMKPTAYLLNTARGGVIDQDALAAALHKGTIAGAALDVFYEEPPLPANHPLLNTPNTLVTPHMAYDSVESMEARCEIVFNSLYSWLGGTQLNKIC